MKVKDFMITSVIAASPAATIKDVMKIMVERKIGGVPIMDKDGKLQGIVTDGDILRAIQPVDRRINDYFSFISYHWEQNLESKIKEMANLKIIKIAKTHGLVTVSPEDDVKQVVQLLAKHHFKKLPVIDQYSHVLGVISRGDMIRCVQNTVFDKMS
ncbi:CBS domain-containing protein [Bacillus salipaludis]|uniref:CBS domain-containing protein n=1 Tax=Bacillus salipaludis TaxID=2547811 RepID=UPI002E1DB7B5|nr:CBS domain-containing protein [Bacillus salipaludis]